MHLSEHAVRCHGFSCSLGRVRCQPRAVPSGASNMCGPFMRAAWGSCGPGRKAPASPPRSVLRMCQHTSFRGCPSCHGRGVSLRAFCARSRSDSESSSPRLCIGPNRQYVPAYISLTSRAVSISAGRSGDRDKFVVASGRGRVVVATQFYPARDRQSSNLHSIHTPSLRPCAASFGASLVAAWEAASGFSSFPHPPVPCA